VRLFSWRRTGFTYWAGFRMMFRLEVLFLKFLIKLTSYLSLFLNNITFLFDIPLSLPYGLIASTLDPIFKLSTILAFIMGY